MIGVNAGVEHGDRGGATAVAVGGTDADQTCRGLIHVATPLAQTWCLEGTGAKEIGNDGGVIRGATRAGLQAG